MTTVDLSDLVAGISGIRRALLLGPLLAAVRRGTTRDAAFLGLAWLALVTALGFLARSLKETRQGDVVLFLFVFTLFGGGLYVAWGAAHVALLDSAARRLFGQRGPQWILAYFGVRPRVPRRLPEGLGWKTLAIAARAGALIVVAVFVGVMGSARGASAGPGGFLFLALAFPLWRLSNRLMAVPAAEVLSRDRRRPVLFLRAFADDTLPSAVYDLGAARGRFEEDLVVPFWKLGPVVALGRPGERLPGHGACRQYCRDDEWQERVGAWMSEAQKVVLVLGATPSLGWEVRQLVARGHLGKTLLVPPPKGGRFVEQCLEGLRGQGLDVDLGGAPAERVLLIGFDDDSRPLVVLCKSRMQDAYELGALAVEALRQGASEGR